MGSGDCEDVAILTVSLLRALGKTATEVFVVEGAIDIGEHAWVVVKEGKKWKIFEPTPNGYEEFKGTLKAGTFLTGLVLSAVNPITGLLTMLGGNAIIDKGFQDFLEQQRDHENFAFNDEYFFDKEGLSFGFIDWYSNGQPTYGGLEAFVSSVDDVGLKMRLTNNSQYPAKTWATYSIFQDKKNFFGTKYEDQVVAKSYLVQLNGYENKDLLFKLGYLPAGNLHFKISSGFLTYAYPEGNRPEISVSE